MKRRLDLTPGFPAFLAAVWYFDSCGIFWPFLAAMTVHELAHAAVLLLLGGRIERNHVGRDSFAVYMMLDGRMTLSWDKGTETVDRGETVLLPACIEEIGLEGRGKLLEIYID